MELTLSHFLFEILADLENYFIPWWDPIPYRRWDKIIPPRDKFDLFSQTIWTRGVHPFHVEVSINDNDKYETIC